MLFRSIKEAGEVEAVLRIWDGYFNSIMQQVKCENGKWTSLAYYFNLGIGWYEESPWLVEDTKEAYQQLSNIEKKDLQDIEQEVLKNMLNCFEYSICNQVDLLISYE